MAALPDQRSLHEEIVSRLLQVARHLRSKVLGAAVVAAGGTIATSMRSSVCIFKGKNKRNVRARSLPNACVSDRRHREAVSGAKAGVEAAACSLDAMVSPS
jgi:hypothetical protein